MKVEIDHAKLDEVVGYLNSMATRVQDLSVPLSDGADLMLADIRAAFSTGGGSLGLSWAPLSQATIRRWGAHQFGMGPTGNLVGSLRKFVRPFVAGVETDMPHAHLFEYGKHNLANTGGGPKVRHNPMTGMIGTANQPGREFLVIRDEIVDKTIEFILDYVVEKAA